MENVCSENRQKSTATRWYLATTQVFVEVLLHHKEKQKWNKIISIVPKRFLREGRSNALFDYLKLQINNFVGEGESHAGFACRGHYSSVTPAVACLLEHTNNTIN